MEKLIEAIKELDAKQYQQQGDELPIDDTHILRLSEKEKEKLKNGEIVPIISESKKLWWMEAAKDADGDWFVFIYSQY